MKPSRGSIWRRWPHTLERGVIDVAITGFRASAWRSVGLQQEKTYQRNVWTIVITGLLLICVGVRFVPFGLIPGLLMVVLELVTMFVSYKFLSWVISSLYGDFFGECSSDVHQAVSAWAAALHFPLIIGAVLGVWSEPWITFPLFRVVGALYGLLVLRHFLEHALKFPKSSVGLVWVGVSSVWILILIGSRVLSLSISATVWVNTLLG